ncbi:MAG: hypothetical protein AAGE43_20935, partial [Pseudomonadota bacterium]
GPAGKKGAQSDKAPDGFDSGLCWTFTWTAVMKKLLKVLHLLSSIGYIGALVAHLFLLGQLPEPAPDAVYVDTRQQIAQIADWVLLPSLALVLIGGLLSIAVHQPYIFMGWPWVKAVSGLVLFEGTLVGVVGPAGRLAELAREITDPELLLAASLPHMRHEWGAIWVMLAIAFFNIVLGVWRPVRLWPKARIGAS